jgi:hypothetical protein
LLPSEKYLKLTTSLVEAEAAGATRANSAATITALAPILSALRLILTSYLDQDGM